MSRHKARKVGPYLPRIFIVLSCDFHASEAFRDGTASKPMERSLVPDFARLVNEDRPCKICNPPPPYSPLAIAVGENHER
jgi:hypothetical protein